VLRYTSNERSDVSRLLRSMVGFGGIMAGRREIKDVAPAWPPGEGEVAQDSAPVKEKEKEKEKEDDGGKAKRKRKKGKK
jgi:hypothetical protein